VTTVCPAFINTGMFKTVVLQMAQANARMAQASARIFLGGSNGCLGQVTTVE
jgi:hypothetical protein